MTRTNDFLAAGVTGAIIGAALALSMLPSKTVRQEEPAAVVAQTTGTPAEILLEPVITEKREEISVDAYAPVDVGAVSELEPVFAELAAARRRIEWLEIELAITGNTQVETPLAKWLSTLREDERPPAAVIRQLGYLLQEFPVVLTPEEGLWLAERFVANDWKLHGVTIDECVVQYFGSARIEAEVPAERLEQLRQDGLLEH